MDGQPRPPLYRDPDLPTSIDIINAFSGGGAALRRGLMAPPKGANPIPAALAVVLAIVGGWLSASAVTLARVAVDELPVVAAPARGVGWQGRVAAAGADRTIVLAERSAVGLSAELDDEIPTSAVRRVPALIDPAGGEGASEAEHATGLCRWLPARGIGTRELDAVTCVSVPAGAEVRVRATSSEIVVLERDAFPSRVDRGYLVQGLVPLALAAGLFTWWLWLVARERAKRRRYRSHVAERMGWPSADHAGGAEGGQVGRREAELR